MLLTSLQKGTLIEATKVDAQECSSCEGDWSYGFSYGYDGFELAVGRLDLAGNIDAEVFDESGSIRRATGSYEVSEDCVMSAEIYSSRGTKIDALRSFLRIRKTIQAVARNKLRLLLRHDSYWGW